MTAVDGRAGQGGAGRGRAGQVSAHANLRQFTGLDSAGRPLPAEIKRLRESAGFQNSKGLRSAGQEARGGGCGGRGAGRARRRAGPSRLTPAAAAVVSGASGPK